MSILTKKKEVWKQIEVCIPKKILPLFTFGYETLVGQEVTSARANARLSAFRWSTAKSKIWRLCTNTRLVSVFPEIMRTLVSVTDTDVIAVDFSDFGAGRQVLMFAKQTRHGRALPLYFEILEYPIQKDSQNLFVIHAIKNFFSLTGCTPALIFDRGFACPSIIHFLAHHKHIFIIRIKKRKRVTLDTGGVTPAEECDDDTSVFVYGHTLRLIVSDDPENGNDPWYLVTNDTTSTREVVVDQYYHRFEIEEFFRDAKRLVGLEYLHMKTTRGLSIMLWFTLLTMWCFATLHDTLTEIDEKLRLSQRLSRFRYVFELQRKELFQAGLWLLESGLLPMRMRV
jgi:hypothetical protein